MVSRTLDGDGCGIICDRLGNTLDGVLEKAAEGCCWRGFQTELDWGWR